MTYSLLSSNKKLDSSNSAEALSIGLAMAPDRVLWDADGNQSALPVEQSVCPFSRGCVRSCLAAFSGRMVTHSVRAAMSERKRLWLDDRGRFERLLRSDLERFAWVCERQGVQGYVRLNVGSDIRWEVETPWVFSEFPELVFYDYTKWPFYERGVGLPENYHLTYSLNEKPGSWDIASNWLMSGRNVAAVFDVYYNGQRKGEDKYGRLPRSWKGWPVVDGDRTDLRIPSVDGSGVIVGLRLKGITKAKESARKSGFALDCSAELKREDLESSTVRELRGKAQSAGITGVSRIRKPELVALLADG